MVSLFPRRISAVTKLTISLLGSFTIADAAGSPVSVPGSKQRAIVAYLALNAGKPTSRDRLMTLLWGERFDEQARQSLRQALTKLRKLATGDPPLLRSDGDTIGFDPDAVEVDALAFEEIAANGKGADLVRAIELYRGEFLENLSVKEAAFEEWASAERARFNVLACSVFEQAAEQQIAGGKIAAAIDTAQRLVKLDPLREPSHRLLMRIYADSGQRAAALKQYATCAGVLSVELGVEPDAETKRLLQDIRKADAGPEAPPGRTSAPSQSATVRPTVAVLPFADLTEGGGGTSLARGMTEDIVAALTKYRWLSILGRFSTTSEPEQLHGVAREQGADYAVEGSVRKFGERIRVNAELVDLRSARYIWVQRYDREAVDALAVQDEIIEQIAGTLEPELASAEGQRAGEKDEANLDAWDCYHLGLAAQYEFSRGGNLEAQRLFRKSVEIDPGFAAARARLAYAMVIGAIYFETKPVDRILDEALQLAKEAARLDDQDAISHFALGRTHLARGEYDLSLRELEAAIDLNPAFAQAHCALGDSLAYAGRLDEAIPRFQEAMRISPHDPYRWAFLTYGSIAYLFRGDHETAAKWAYEAVRVPNAHYGANAALVAALGHLDRPEECRGAVADLLRAKPDFSLGLAKERLFYLKDQDQLEHYLEGLRRAGLSE
jgi:DNA-binding SARP family transcriptional activator